MFTLKSIASAAAVVTLTAMSTRVDAAMLTGGTNIALNNGYQCVEVAGGYTTPGTPVQSWSCWGGFNQQWNFFQGQILGIGSETNGNSVRNCMEVAGSSTASGARVQLNACTGRINQQWILSGGTIVSALSKRCLDLGAGYSQNLVQLTVKTCNGSVTQQFAIR